MEKKDKIKIVRYTNLDEVLKHIKNNGTVGDVLLWQNPEGSNFLLEKMDDKFVRVKTDFVVDLSTFNFN